MTIDMDLATPLFERLRAALGLSEADPLVTLAVATIRLERLASVEVADLSTLRAYADEEYSDPGQLGAHVPSLLAEIERLSRLVSPECSSPSCDEIAALDGDILLPACEAHGGKPEVRRG